MNLQINRRRFLQTASASLAYSALGAHGLDLVNAKPRRVGLIGAGWYGKSDLCRLIQVAPVEVMSICDPDKNMLAGAMKLISERQKSKKAPRAFADYPGLFRQISQPETDYLAIPEVSSERRHFIPIAFVGKNIICSNTIQFVANAKIYHFGIIASTMHNAWMRYTCGRLKSDFRYSGSIVYNNFPWPNQPTDAQHEKIEAAAQAVLDARSQFPDATLADLYDPLTMPPALVKAHQKLDAAVDAAYGKKSFKNDAERVAFLFTLYQQYTSLLPAAGKTKHPRKSKT